MDKKKIIALVDCDSFFVSCEQALDKTLQDKPVCVLSNNDACIIARSKEAKKMGVKMGMPYFMAKKEFPNAIYVSGNHRLYKNFSKKVMAILRDFTPDVQVYSIDEAFVELSGVKKLHRVNYYKLAKQIRDRIKTELDINVSIGLSGTKVLAKLACEKAKTSGGIYLIGACKIKKELKKTKIQEIWGIGKNTTVLLNRRGILTCEELVEKTDEWLKTVVGKNGVELKHELLGESINYIKSARRLPKSIQNTSSFPTFTSDVNYIKNALNQHIHTSCTKLRYLKGKCNCIAVMLRTKDFRTFWEKKTLPVMTNFEIEISRIAIEMLEKIHDKDTIYRSCGIVLDNLDFSTEDQLSLFISAERLKNVEKLAEAIDKIEAKFGRNSVKTGFLE